MGTPKTSLATLRPELGESMEDFDLATDRQGFIGHHVLPTIDVALQGGTYGRVPLEELLKSPETKRTSGGGYNRIYTRFEDAAYACEENGLEAPVDDRDAKIYGNYFDAELIAAEAARDGVVRGRERRIASLLFNPTTWTGSSLTKSITNEWDKNHTTDAVPIDDVNDAVEKVYDNCGLWPNALIINRKVFRNLRRLDQILEAIAASGAGNPNKQSDITVKMLAQVFDLEYIFVAGGSENLSDENQDAEISQIWSSEYAMVARIAKTRGIKEAALGNTFHWSADGSMEGAVMESYRDETVRSDIIRARHDTDEVIRYVEAAVLLDNVTTL